MSTLGRISPFSLLFYSNEGTEPPHAFSLASQGRPWRNTAGGQTDELDPDKL